MGMEIIALILDLIKFALKFAYGIRAEMLFEPLCSKVFLNFCLYRLSLDCN